MLAIMDCYCHRLQLNIKWTNCNFLKLFARKLACQEIHGKMQDAIFINFKLKFFLKKNQMEKLWKNYIEAIIAARESIIVVSSSSLLLSSSSAPMPNS